MAEIRAGMGAAELDSWAAFYIEEPWGVVRDNFHAGIIASIIGNTHLKKGARAFRPSDFLLVGAQEREARRDGARGTLLTALRTIGKRKRKGAKGG